MGGQGTGLVMQELKDIAPFTQIHVSFYARSVNFQAVQYNVEVRCLLPVGRGQEGVGELMGRRLSWWSLQLESTQPWARFEYITSSWDCQTPVALFVGVEDRGSVSGHDGQEGDLYFDDILVTTTALVNVL